MFALLTNVGVAIVPTANGSGRFVFALPLAALLSVYLLAGAPYVIASRPAVFVYSAHNPANR